MVGLTPLLSGKGLPPPHPRAASPLGKSGRNPRHTFGVAKGNNEYHGRGDATQGIVGG